MGTDEKQSRRRFFRRLGAASLVALPTAAVARTSETVQAQNDVVAAYIHGNTFQVEGPGVDLLQVSGIPWTDITGFCHGGGLTFRGRARTWKWFHASIPVTGVGGGPHILRAQALFTIRGPNAAVRKFHVWNGAKWIGPILNDVWGIDEVSWYSDRPAPVFGINICLNVYFGDQDTDITFHSANATFLV